jgi:hypothetical protein
MFDACGFDEFFLSSFVPSVIGKRAPRSKPDA